MYRKLVLYSRETQRISASKLEKENKQNTDLEKKNRIAL